MRQYPGYITEGEDLPTVGSIIPKAGEPGLRRSGEGELNTAYMYSFSLLSTVEVTSRSNFLLS